METEHDARLRHLRHQAAIELGTAREQLRSPPHPQRLRSSIDELERVLASKPSCAEVKFALRALQDRMCAISTSAYLKSSADEDEPSEDDLLGWFGSNRDGESPGGQRVGVPRVPKPGAGPAASAKPIDPRGRD